MACKGRCRWWLVVAVVIDVGCMIVGVALPYGDAASRTHRETGGPMMLGVVEEMLEDYINGRLFKEESCLEEEKIYPKII